MYLVVYEYYNDVAELIASSTLCYTYEEAQRTAAKLKKGGAVYINIENA